MKEKKIRIGTRGSKLALVQTELVIDAMKQVLPDLEYEIVIIQTTGDKILDKPLAEFGGKAVFVSEFEEALLWDEIDFAVHSAKDMPMELSEGLDIVGVLKRDDPKDVLITQKGTNIHEKSTALIGTSSLRRQFQIEQLYHNIECHPIRGNVNTRLNKLREGQYDGIILAAAGINRLKLNQESDFQYKYLDIDECIPAGGQGIIAIEGKKNSEWVSLCEKITDRNAKIELEIERRALKYFNAGCHEPIGVYAKASENQITVWMMKEINGEIVRKKETGNISKGLELARAMVNNIMESI